MTTSYIIMDRKTFKAVAELYHGDKRLDFINTSKYEILTTDAYLKSLVDRPLAVESLKSYRYKGRYGYCMIGATDNANALVQAQRSCDYEVIADRLEVWDGTRYTSPILA